MTTAIHGICSMATRALLDELVATHGQRTGVQVAFEAVGGVDAARRVIAGEAFDVVALASNAIDNLIAEGKLDASTRVDLARSGVGMAVRAGAAPPDISDEDMVRRAVQKARRVAYSTGPSGVALMALFKRWGIDGELEGRLVQAPPGVPVGALIARGDADLGFQQLSELVGLEGIELVGALPPAIQITTVFTAAAGMRTAHRDAVKALLQFLVSTDSIDAKRRLGMEQA